MSRPYGSTSGKKVPLNLTVPPELPLWFKRHDIQPSAFLESRWREYVDTNSNFKAEVILDRIDSLRDEVSHEEEMFSAIVGKTIEEYWQEKKANQESCNESPLDRLWNALGEDKQQWIIHERKGKRHLIIAWLKTRSRDFDIFQPPAETYESLMKKYGGRKP